MYGYQGMVVMTVNQVWWTWEVEDVFTKVRKGDKMGMKNYAKKLHSQIDDLVIQVEWSGGMFLLLLLFSYLNFAIAEVFT